MHFSSERREARLRGSPWDRYRYLCELFSKLLERRCFRHSSELKIREGNVRETTERKENEHVANLMIVSSSADSISLSFSPTFSMIPAPLSYDERMQRSKEIPQILSNLIIQWHLIQIRSHRCTSANRFVNHVGISRTINDAVHRC